MLVFFPFCLNDQPLLIFNLRWLQRLHGKSPFTCVLHTDIPTGDACFAPVWQEAQRAFSKVIVTIYRCRWRRWPHAPNESFKQAVMRAKTFGSPWLWCEPDAFAIRPDWLQILQNQYIQRGRPFFGPMVGGYGGHLNGTSIYPADVEAVIGPLNIPQDVPFDVALKEKIFPYAADASPYIQQCGAVRDGCCVTESSPSPSFPDVPSLDIVHWSAALFHPCKDGTLATQMASLLQL